ncbi:MAG: HD domain-containing protein [Syntrophomonadaceae bacterium]|jgi:3'-5' exoribonuclease|nr:HD domain-containing protein [Syntrophomonadaceae bacterium]
MDNDNNKKGPYTISELKAFTTGQQIWGKYLLLALYKRKTRDGKDFSNLKIGDKSGEIDVVAWENCQWSGDVEAGRVIGLLGDIGFYNNRQQLTAKRIKILDGEDNINYQKSPETDINVLVVEFERSLQEVEDLYLQGLLQIIFTSERKNKFFQSPAAKKIHHNYTGGLLEHTVYLIKLSRRIAEVYPKINKDLLLAGALLHDVGKTAELSMSVVTPEYTTVGRLLGHITLGADIVAEAVREYRRSVGFFPEELEMALRHMILSHHGVLEFGSPVKPLFPEAFMLYFMDNLDAKMFVYFNQIEEDKENPALFTPYDNLYQQNYYKYRYSYEKMKMPAQETETEENEAE